MPLLQRVFSNESLHELIVLLDVRQLAHRIVPVAHSLKSAGQIIGVLLGEQSHDGRYLAVYYDVNDCQLVASDVASTFQTFVNDLEETALV